MNNTAVKWTARLLLWELVASFFNLSIGMALINAECRDNFYPPCEPVTQLFSLSRLFWINAWMVGGVCAFVVIGLLCMLASQGLKGWEEEENE